MEERQELRTLEDIREKALARLGLMTDGTYADFMAMITVEAAKMGVYNPRLVIGLVYIHPRHSASGVRDRPYLIGEHEWARVLGQVSEYLDGVPVVWAIDADKFSVV